jgi:hypothetical protein
MLLIDKIYYCCYGKLGLMVVFCFVGGILSLSLSLPLSKKQQKIVKKFFEN